MIPLLPFLLAISCEHVQSSPMIIKIQCYGCCIVIPKYSCAKFVLLLAQTKGNQPPFRSTAILIIQTSMIRVGICVCSIYVFLLCVCEYGDYIIFRLICCVRGAPSIGNMLFCGPGYIFSLYSVCFMYSMLWLYVLLLYGSINSIQ